MQNAPRWHEVYNNYAQTLIHVKARQLVCRPGFSQSDQDDIEQILAIHLLLQAQHFNPDRASLSTFIARVVDSAVAMLLRERRRLKRGPRFVIQSLDLLVEQTCGRWEPLGATVSRDDLDRRTTAASRSEADRREEAEAIAEVMKSLSPEMQDLCRRLMGGTVTSVARDLDISRRKLRSLIGTMRRHFLRAGLGEE